MPPRLLERCVRSGTSRQDPGEEVGLGTVVGKEEAHESQHDH